MFAILASFCLGLVIWFVFPGFSGRKANLILIVGLVILALLSGSFGVPEIPKEAELPSAETIISGTVSEKQAFAESLAQATESLKQQILNSRDPRDVVQKMAEFRKLKRASDTATTEYNLRRFSPPNF